MSEINNIVSMRIAELLIAEIESAVQREEFGVIARDIVPLDREHFLMRLPELMAKTGKKLRISLVREHNLVSEFCRTHPKYADLVASDEETAVQWRNQNLKTIVVIADGPLSKAASLNTFRQLDERLLIARLSDCERDKAEVVWLRTLWDSLKSKRCPTLSLQALARFASTLLVLPTQERSMKAPTKLGALGLFPDIHLADEGTEARIVKRLRTNAEMLMMVRNAAPEDWDRMASFCRQLLGKEKTRFNGIRKRLKEIDYK